MHRRNCVIHDATIEQMAEVKTVERRRTQLLDDLKNRRHWKLKIKIGGNDSLSHEQKEEL